MAGVSGTFVAAMQAQMVGPPQTPVKRPPVAETALENLKKSVQDVDSMVTGLCQRLAPIMRIEPEEAQTGTQVQEEWPPYYSEIRRCTDHISRLASTLLIALERLEI